MNKFFIFALSLTFCIANGNSQPKKPEASTINNIIIKEVIITGKVIDKETQKPLEYATIAFFSKKENKIVTGGITDINGVFSILVKTGIYDISIEYIAFKTQRILNKKVTVNENIGLFSLEIDAESLAEIEVIAERTTVEIKLDKKIYNVGKDLTVSGGTVSDVLDNVPSVSVDVEGNIALRGNDNVRILINGKPSGLVGLNTTDVLKQLPAESIEKVEVITSPSARYEAEGTAGILNIILRRSKLQGLNGAITANGGYPNTAGISGNINYRTGDINFFNTTSYNYRESPGYSYNFTRYKNTGNFLDEKNNWLSRGNGITSNIGLEWYVNETSSITTSLVYSDRSGDNESVNVLTQYDSNFDLTGQTIREKPELTENKTIQYALNYTKNFKTSGHKLSFDFQYEDTDQNRSEFVNQDGIDTEIAFTPEEESKILIQTDYVLPIGENQQFEFGFRGDYSDTTTDYSVEIFNQNLDNFELDTNLSNLFNFKMYLNSVYSQYGSKINKFSYLLGLRLENTQITIDQPTSGDFEKKNFTGLFPTVNLNYEISDTENVTLGYNRRLSRPRGFYLNPFPSRSSLTNIFQGNPDLDPSYSSNFDLGYLKRFGKFTLSSSMYYQHTIQEDEWVSIDTGNTVIINGETLPVIQRTPVNVGTNDRYGFEFNLNYAPSKKWRINSDFNFFKSITKGEFNGINLDANNITWSMRINNKYTLPGDIDWQTSLRYRGPREDAQNKRRGNFSSRMALSKDLFKEKASIAFNINDVLNSNRFQGDVDSETFFSTREIRFRGVRNYNLSFTYRFNQKKKTQRGKRGNGDFDFEG
ncbi:TonB-dependent receptor [Sabulilitoribacter arenilitoris]|uniref:TonB-dependent receptor n=1 Tax=Wocania arenilitoris TaxID=2044858 RepID=A0AAE3ER33_9FLAO|nr:TonB-dependent receptor [Wocania arenilitoris]MCF7569087.1 TonB-dependent receptor [Wocania arenilitoris]